MSESPQDRLSFYVDGHINLVRSMGGDCDPSQVRDGTAKILEIADREALPRQDAAGEKHPDDVREEKRRQGPEALAAAAGGEFFYGNEREESLAPNAPAAPRIPTGLAGERHIALLARLAMIMAPIPGYRLKPGEDMGNRFQSPRLAMLLARTTQDAQLSDPKSTGSGIYRGLSLPDRQRRYYRRLEQICDQSNAAFRFGWWVKH